MGKKSKARATEEDEPATIRSSLPLCPTSLPAFATSIIPCADGQMSALEWSFCCNVPPFARAMFMDAERTTSDNDSLSALTTPQMQWNYSVFHVASWYADQKTQHKTFLIQDEAESAAILLDVTDLRSCPENIDKMNAMPRSSFVKVDANGRTKDDESLGPVPIFFVRYVHQNKPFEKWQHSREVAALVGGKPLMCIKAASREEIVYGALQLERGKKFVQSRSEGKKTNGERGTFQHSVLYPSLIEQATKAIEETPFICASCGSVITKRPAPSCSRCKVTTYCDRDCQVAHWKKGGHKQACGKKRRDEDGQRQSFSFNIDDASPYVPPGMVHSNFNHNTGTVNLKGMTEDQQAAVKAGITQKGVTITATPDARNIYGDQEFIVKIQPPASRDGGYTRAGQLPDGPWMCYDRPRSFQAYIPDTTSGLVEAYALLQQRGIKSSNPMTGQRGYKGYFHARWEGSNVRIYYDRLAPHQPW